MLSTGNQPEDSSKGRLLRTSLHPSAMLVQFCVWALNSSWNTCTCLVLVKILISWFFCWEARKWHSNLSRCLILLVYVDPPSALNSKFGTVPNFYCFLECKCLFILTLPMHLAANSHRFIALCIHCIQMRKACKVISATNKLTETNQTRYMWVMWGA